ncbi:MAG TPA: YciC family protein [Solirubrobacterales bacterium]|nr:YciC family protein [Solirubrobacterales bacterium]
MRSLRSRLRSTYARIGHTYWSWKWGLLLLSVVIFVPLGLLDALALQVDVESLDLNSGIKVAALLTAIALATTTGLLGEVFFSGAVAISLTHPEHDRPPPLSHIARQINYRRLIALDILYVILVAVGFALLIVPGVLVFIWLGLAGPVVEIEERTVRGAFRRSWELVRGNFWFVFWVLVPVEVIGDALGDGVAHLIHDWLGDTLVAGWLAESASNIVLSPAFAVAAVLLTVELIHQKDGSGPRVHSAPGVTA